MFTQGEEVWYRIILYSQLFLQIYFLLTSLDKSHVTIPFWCLISLLLCLRGIIIWNTLCGYLFSLFCFKCFLFPDIIFSNHTLSFHSLVLLWLASWDIFPSKSCSKKHTFLEIRSVNICLKSLGREESSLAKHREGAYKPYPGNRN